MGKARFSPPPEPPLNPIEPTLIETVPMRDGVKLYTEIFLPNSKNGKQTQRSQLTR